MKITVLASGSKGNATWIETPTKRVLIDCGISYKKLCECALAKGIILDTLDAILLTHEHVDHTRGLPVVLAKTEATLYTPMETYRHLMQKSTYPLDQVKHQPIEPEKSFWLDDLEIIPVAISHDAVSTIGFILNHNDKKVIYMTDIGFLPASDYDKLQNADLYIFEANYDVALLFASPRPYYLKKRIDSIRGHLSNQDAAYHLSRLIGPKTTTIILAHPSEECNTESHALRTLHEVFASYALDVSSLRIFVAKQHEPLDSIVL